MTTVYLDSNFCCHVNPGDGRTEYETGFFDNKCASFIEGYRLVPEGETWERDDGVIFRGLMIAPATDYMVLQSKQEQYEEDSDNMMPLEDVAELIEALYEADLEVIG